MRVSCAPVIENRPWLDRMLMAIRFGFCANPNKYVIVMVMVREQDSQIPNPGIQDVSLPVDPVQAR